jgi:hypothetical protein
MLIVLLVVGLLAGLGLVAPLLPPEWLVQAGWSCTWVGLLLGVPTGFWYHVKLRSSLRRMGILRERWWLRPVAFHDQMGREDRPAVLFWFYLGGAGFFLTVLGCLLVGAGVVLQGFRAGVF